MMKQGKTNANNINKVVEHHFFYQKEASVRFFK